MGKDSNIKAQRIHTRKLFNGQTTAEEVHRKYAFPPDAHCKCGSPKVAIRVRSFFPMSRLLKDHPQTAMHIAAQHSGNIPIVEMRGPGNVPVKYVRIGDAFACDMCKRELEVAASKHPSDVIIHVDRGPGPERPVFQVADNLIVPGK